MKIKHEKTLLPPEAPLSLARIENCSWSPTGNRLAVCTSSNNQVTLFSGVSLDKKEKFALKPVDKSFSKTSFSVKGLSFSPDSTKIAIGQTDCVIYVFKIGLEVGEKKVISGKYTIPSACTCLVWHESGIVFGSADGKVKLIQTSTNRMLNVISSNSMVISMAVSGDNIAIGFLAGAVVLTTIGSKDSSKQLGTSTSPPFALTMTAKGVVCFGGSDGKVTFINTKSSNASEVNQTLELGSEINTASSSPTGNFIVIGSEENLILFKFENYWRKTQTIELTGGHLITNISWTKDGTRMSVGTVNGGLEVFSFEWKKKMIGDKFQVDFVGANQVVITDVSIGNKAMFKSIHEIEDVKIVKERFAVIRTPVTILVGDTSNASGNKTSEVEWTGMSMQGMKFCFDYEGVVLINIFGELYVVELGQNEFLSSVRTDFVNPHLMSVRMNERNSGVKILAYLLDLKTICVLDLVTNGQLCVCSHDAKIDWMQLNETGKKMLFRDRFHRLNLLDIDSQESQVILNFCAFVQWVPFSDVLIAQSDDKLYVWYNLTKPIILDIPGGNRTEVTGIERNDGKTRVILSNKSELLLDESLLEFDTSLRDGDLERAMSYLEKMPSLTPESESMWRHLAKVALKNNNLLIAERSYAAIGDYTRVIFIHESEGDLYRLALLDKDWTTFEMNDFDEAIDTYIGLNKWQRAIDLAARSGRQDVQEDLQEKYFKYLMESGQEAEAAAVKEKSGDLLEAIKLYQSSGRVVQAAKVILEAAKSRRSSEIPDSMISNIIEDLKSSKFWSEAGDLYESVLKDSSAALEAYVSGKDFVKAIDLARREFPDEVVPLEGKFGEYLMTDVKDPSTAIGHLIEAGKTERALEAAVQAGQFDRASEISMVLDKVPPVFARQIAEYYAGRNEIDYAIEIFMNSGLQREAVNLLNSKGQYNRGLKLAKKIMPEDEVLQLFGDLASSLKDQGKVKEAEKVYLTIRDTDAAISMYKQLEQYDNMIRLVQQYHPDLLRDTHLHLGQKLKEKGSLKEAESHYLSAGDWTRVIEMYKESGKWEDAYRVARSHAGPGVTKEVAFLWVSYVTSSSSPAEGVKLLTRIGLLHQVIDFAIESKTFDFALSLVLAAGPEVKFKVNEIKFMNALFLEDQGRLSDAEVLFLEAGKAKEAARMYVRAKSFPDALRITERYLEDESAVSDVLVAQAKFIIEIEGRSPESLARVESLLLRAGRMELMVKMYREEGMYEDAFRVAQQFVPNMIDSVKRDMAANSRGSDISLMDGFASSPSQRSSRASLSRRSSITGVTDDDSFTGIEDGRVLRQNLERAERSGDKDRIKRYAFILANQLIKEKDPVEALKVISNHPDIFLHPEAGKLLTKISSDILSFNYESNPGVSVFRVLRDTLFSLITNQSLSDDSKESRLLLICHYMVLKTTLAGLKNSYPASQELLVKISTSLLRYTDVVRVDKAFYEAGLLAKENNKNDMAFVFWNHFLDLMEGIEEENPDVDHSELSSTDIPASVPLPSSPFFGDPSVVDEVKSWILQMTMDDTEGSKHTLPLCSFRDGDVFEASLKSPDGSSCLPCIVTGYPVIRHKMMQLKEGKYAANKDDWNKLLMLTKMSSSEDLREVLLFIGRLCGNASVARFSFQ